AGESTDSGDVYGVEARRQTGCAAPQPVRGPRRVLPLRDGRSEGIAAAVARTGLRRARAGAAGRTRGAAMSTAVERFDERARARFGEHARTVVHEDEVLRHPVYTRVLHWSVAGFFILALLSGFAIYTPWLYRSLTPIFGGGPMTRLLHPWFSLGFVVCFAFQTLNWLQPMSWTADDRQWMRRVRDYVANTEKREPE